MRTDLYTNPMNEGAAIEFATDDEAENYVLAHPEKMAIVVKNRLVVTEFYGKNYEVKK